MILVRVLLLLVYPQNSLCHRWSQLSSIIDAIHGHEPSNFEYLDKAIEILFCMEQFHLLATNKNGRRYNKYVLIFATEIFNVSPAAYRMFRRYEALGLPSERLIHKLISRAFQDENLENLFEKLKPEQRLVNLIFDEVKLKETTYFTGGYIVGHASNKNCALATSALGFEIVCHYGWPRYILRIDPVAGINAEQLKYIIMEVFHKVKENGGFPVSFICDNCSVNQSAFSLLGGPGKVYLILVRYIWSW